jgi:hypothetical protein
VEETPGVVPDPLTPAPVPVTPAPVPVAPVPVPVPVTPAPVPVPQPQPPETKSGRLPSGFSTIRDIVTFVIGLGLIIYEVTVPHEVRPYVLAVGLTMAGLPLVFGADEKRKDK